MPARRIGLACPLCDAAGITSHLYEVPPSLATLCESGNLAHRWNDTNELRELHPRKLELPKPKVIAQHNYVSLAIQAPATLETNLRQKYGNTYENSVLNILSACAEQDLMMLNASDLDRIEQRCGTRPTSSAELFGLIFQMGEEVNDLRTEVKRLERASFIRKKGTGLNLDLGIYMSKAAEKAHEANMNIEEYLSQYLQQSLENDWIAV